MRLLLEQVRVHLEEVRFERIDERDIETVHPHADRAVGVDRVLVPGAVGRQHEIVLAERHAVAVDDRIGALALHDEAQRRRGVVVRGRPLAGVHHLQAGVEPAACRRHVAAAGIVEIDDAAAGLLGCDEFEAVQNVVAQVAVAPQRRHRRRLRLPRLDRIGDRPQRAGFEPLQFLVVGRQLGRVLDIGPADDVLAHCSHNRNSLSRPRQQPRRRAGCIVTDHAMSIAVEPAAAAGLLRDRRCCRRPRATISRRAAKAAAGSRAGRTRRSDCSGR